MDEYLIVEITLDESTTFPMITVTCRTCCQGVTYSVMCDFGSLVRFYKEHEWCRR
jgi:hypothetical protein